MHNGYICLFLHAHLPFVRHPEEEYFLEENWLYEAITETYLPLLDIFERLTHDGVFFRITMSLTPTLCSMLADPLLQARYEQHITRLIECAGKEVDRTADDPDLQVLARMYLRRFTEIKDAFVLRYNRNLVLAFREFQDTGSLEIVASCATHGFLPNLRANPASIRAQIGLGIEHYRATFGRDPYGFWIPECAYYPGLDEMLKAEGIRYFFVDGHALLNADPAPRNSVYAPVYCQSGVAAFGRDRESSEQVWSSKVGYPGDPAYREYYRDIGFDCDLDYIKPYIHPDGIRINTGIKYWRITGNSESKEVYKPDMARAKVAEHAGNFMFNREKQIEHWAGTMDRKPIVVAPYDAELFGHWWYEGPQFLDILIRKLYFDQQAIRMITPSGYLEEYPANMVATPSESSWGYKGYAEYWLEGSNDWIWRHLHEAGSRMHKLVCEHESVVRRVKHDPLLLRALDQAARELVLAESSDWPFIMKTKTMVPYANKRLRTHLGRFTKIYEDIKNNRLDAQWLSEIEWRDNIFYYMHCARHYLPEHTDKRDYYTVKSVRKPTVRKPISKNVTL